MSIGLFYGTDTGNTQRVADMIVDELGMDVEVIDISDATAEDFARFDKIILGQPTWYYGERQSHWDEFWPEFEKVSFAGKTVALFGLGDQYDYSEYFLDAMGMMNEVVLANGGTVVGAWPIKGYEFDESKALLDDDHFVGLGIDEDQQADQTPARVAAWVKQIKGEMGI